MKFEKLCINKIKNRKFIIPFYQRDYVWDGFNLNDFVRGSSKFIGNLVVKNDEIIDGQQRLMSIFLLSRFLNRECFKISYAIEDEDNKKLENLSHDNFEKTEFAMQGLNEACCFIARKLKSDEISQTLDRLNFTITDLPSHIEAGGYFEAINANKVHLRKSDILKAKFIGTLKDTNIDVAGIWENCEDMESYFTRNFDEFKIKNKSENIKINDILENDSCDNCRNKNKQDSRIRSIVDFEEFLLVVGKSLDDKMSLSTKGMIKDFSEKILPEKSEDFIKLLCEYRRIFDEFVFKRFGDDQHIFGEKDMKDGNKNIDKEKLGLLMIQLLFEVQGSNEWLVKYLKFSRGRATIKEHIDFLENLDRVEHPIKNELDWGIDAGTNTPHYWFYKLEYLLWKNFDKYFKNMSNLNRDTYRLKRLGSVEHIHPQSKIGENGFDTKDFLDNFGNLALLSSSRNSTLGNLPVGEKLARIKTWKINGSIQSLKMLLALTSYSNWGVQSMQAHGEEMKRLLIADLKNN